MRMCFASLGTLKQHCSLPRLLLRGHIRVFRVGPALNVTEREERRTFGHLVFERLAGAT